MPIIFLKKLMVHVHVHVHVHVCVCSFTNAFYLRV
jgi:hypothetical protein